MTIKELYQWSVENECENLPLRIWWYSETSTLIQPEVDCDEGYVDI